MHLTHMYTTSRHTVVTAPSNANQPSIVQLYIHYYGQSKISPGDKCHTQEVATRIPKKKQTKKTKTSPEADIFVVEEANQHLHIHNASYIDSRHNLDGQLPRTCMQVDSHPCGRTSDLQWTQTHRCKARAETTSGWPSCSGPGRWEEGGGC